MHQKGTKVVQKGYRDTAVHKGRSKECVLIAKLENRKAGRADPIVK